MSKTMKILTVMILGMLLGCFMFGCGNEEPEAINESSLDPCDVAIIFANRANSASNLDDARKYIEAAAQNECFLACVLADGQTQPISDVLTINGNNERRRNSAIEENINSILNMDWSALKPESDIYSAVLKANNELGLNKQTDAPNVLLIVDSGISTAGPINFNEESARKGLLDPEGFVSKLRSEGDLAKLDNIDKIIWYGIGATNDPQEKPNPGAIAALKNFYVAIFNASDVSDVVFENSSEKEPSGNLPKVSTVSIPTIAVDDNGNPIGLGDTLIFDESKGTSLTFKTGTSSFINREDALNELKDTIAQLKSYPDLHVTISGYTDTVGSKQANQALSEKRAKTVANMLLKAGISKSQITSVGRGESSKNGKGDVAANRRVELKFT